MRGKAFWVLERREEQEFRKGRVLLLTEEARLRGYVVLIVWNGRCCSAICMVGAVHDKKEQGCEGNCEGRITCRNREQGRSEDKDEEGTGGNEERPSR